MILFIKLLLSHLIGDFILQPASRVKEKTTKKHRSGQLCFHRLIDSKLEQLFVLALVMAGMSEGLKNTSNHTKKFDSKRETIKFVQNSFIYYSN
jgi:hypothetical protein